MKTVVTICAGGGLADVGLKAAGYQPIGAVEIEPAIAEVYRANHGDHVTVMDARLVDWSKFDKPTGLWASPSCKNASIANQNAGESTLDMEMGEAICRAIRTLMPEWFMLENVRGYAGFKAFGLILHTLEELGYWHNGGEVLNSADFGVPQTRVRLILRATRADCVKSGQPNMFGGGKLAPLAYKERWNGWYGAIEDLIPDLPESKFADWQIERIKSLPDSQVSQMFNGQENEGRAASYRRASEPSLTVTAAMGRRPTQIHHAFLLMTGASSSNEQTGGTGIKEITTPSGTVATNSERMARAFILSGTEQRAMPVRAADEPIWAQSAAAGDKGPPRAFIANGTPNNHGETLTTRSDCENGFAITAQADKRQVLRAMLERGRVVRMTPRALARFQSVPDSYQLPDKQYVNWVCGGRGELATTIIGNGVACEFAEKVVRLHEGDYL